MRIYVLRVRVRGARVCVFRFVRAHCHARLCVARAVCVCCVRCVLWGSLRAAPPAWVVALGVFLALRVHVACLRGCWGAQHPRVRLRSAMLVCHAR